MKDSQTYSFSAGIKTNALEILTTMYLYPESQNKSFNAIIRSSSLKIGRYFPLFIPIFNECIRIFSPSLPVRYFTC